MKGRQNADNSPRVGAHGDIAEGKSLPLFPCYEADARHGKEILVRNGGRTGHISLQKGLYLGVAQVGDLVKKGSILESTVPAKAHTQVVGQVAQSVTPVGKVKQVNVQAGRQQRAFLVYISVLA